MSFWDFSNILRLLSEFATVLLSWGWLFIVFFALWIAWEVYLRLKQIDYVSAIHFTYLQITVPEETPQTPKAMEQAFEVWGGIHKNPDLLERYFEGYMLAWYTCELECTRNRVRFIMVVPTVHRKFFEGVIYGQYPTAEIREVEDYAQAFPHRDLEKTFDLYGTEMVLVREDIFPIRTYHDYEDALAEDERYIDPLQALIEAFTTIEEGEHFWFQLLVRPVSASDINTWSERGQEEINRIAGRVKEKPPGVTARLFEFLTALPGELFQAATKGPLEASAKNDIKPQRLFMTPPEQDITKAILQKVGRSGFRTKMRVVHIAPVGKLHKPNASKAIGVFKQFNTSHLNSLKPDDATKTNGPNYILKQTRRRYRKRVILLNYQFRDFWGDKSGSMMTAEELATLFHFPSKYGRSPSIQRATSGLGSAPENLPYI
ncbi:MAG: hypothetical protein WEA04_00120 [Candidatus Andersenbacteria bacterium]